MNQVAIGYLEMAACTMKPEEPASAYIGRSLAGLYDSSRLIGNLRKVQQATGKKLKLEKVDLDDVLSQVKSEYSMVPGREVTVRYKPAKGYVMANQLLKDVFLNIVGNAVKHSSGSVSVDILVSKATKGGKDYCLVAVEDNGPGIPDGRKASIFSRAERAAKAMGGGLGLYIVKSLVEGFDGRVWVEDRVDGDHSKGCRFIVMLPAAG
jgi:signal transduction histidine kinase